MFKDNITRVFFLKKVLYSLKQSLRIWYLTLLVFFCKFDFHKMETNYDLFILADKTIFVAIYVDELFLFGVDINPHIDNVMQNL